MCGHEQLMGVAPRCVTVVQVFVTGCAVLALHWCIKHSETAVQLYSLVVEVREEI